MADIFISYKKEDAGRVVRIVEALRAEGFSVWWDHGITPGAQWDQTIHQELNAAKVVMAIWSEQSVSAPWVKEEAGVGKRRGILLPIRIDDVEPPLGFSLIQMGDLIGWNGDTKDPHWKLVLSAIRAIISGERPQGLEAPPKRGNRFPIIGAIAGVMLLLAVAVGATLYFNGDGATGGGEQTASVESPQRPPAPPPAASGPDGSAPAASAPAASTAVATPPAAAPPSALPAPGAPASAAEQTLWDQALAAKTRQAFQNYLVLYPSGSFAARARDVLLTCRTEMRDVWQPGRVGQLIRGVNATVAPTEAAACRAAREDARANGERACRGITANDGYRNGQVTFTDAPCTCQQVSGGYVCHADPAYSCTWEMRSKQQVEVCGG